MSRAIKDTRRESLAGGGQSRGRKAHRSEYPSDYHATPSPSPDTRRDYLRNQDPVSSSSSSSSSFSPFPQSYRSITPPESRIRRHIPDQNIPIPQWSSQQFQNNHMYNYETPNPSRLQKHATEEAQNRGNGRFSRTGPRSANSMAFLTPEATNAVIQTTQEPDFQWQLKTTRPTFLPFPRQYRALGVTVPAASATGTQPPNVVDQPRGMIVKGQPVRSGDPQGPWQVHHFERFY